MHLKRPADSSRSEETYIAFQTCLGREIALGLYFSFFFFFFFGGRFKALSRLLFPLSKKRWRLVRVERGRE